jgi:hypothetical protein
MSTKSSRRRQPSISRHNFLMSSPRVLDVYEVDMESSFLDLTPGAKRRGEKAHTKCDCCRRKKIKVSHRQSLNLVVLFIEPSLKLRINSAFLPSETGLSKRSASHVKEVGTNAALIVVSTTARCHPQPRVRRRELASILSLPQRPRAEPI